MDAERRRDDDIDRIIGALASGQGGVVSRRQLEASGVTRGAIGRRIEMGRLLKFPGHRGVLAVGHTARAQYTALWAAHLALGAGSVVSHRSAGWRLELLPSPTRAELTVRSDRRRRKAFLVHRTDWLPASHVVELDGLPVTSVARTLLDLGAVAPRRRVEQAFERAEILRLLDLRDVERVLAEGGSRPGTAALRAVLGREHAGSTLTDSWLGERLLMLIRRAGLPEPRQQYPVLEYRPDFCWPEARLIVEADGAGAHGTRRGHAHDTRRDVLLTNAGWTVLRFAYDAIVHDPRYVEHAIRTALARGRRSA
jgi:very-short-patch-repair endonuclease